MSFTARIATMMIASVGTVVLALPIAADPSSNQSMGEGKAAFNNQCRTCHSIKEGDNRLGPSLHGILGAKAGANSGYASYSQAMKSAGIVWDEATLDRFIADPEAVVPNNNMKPFKAVPEASVRKAIVGYLKAESGAG